MNKWLIVGIVSLALVFIPDPLDAIFGIGVVVEAAVAAFALFKVMR